MKKYSIQLPIQLLAIAAMVLLFAACTKNTRKTQTYTIYSPVYASKAQVLASINGSASEAI